VTFGFYSVIFNVSFYSDIRFLQCHFQCQFLQCNSVSTVSFSVSVSTVSFGFYSVIFSVSFYSDIRFLHCHFQCKFLQCHSVSTVSFLVSVSTVPFGFISVSEWRTATSGPFRFYSAIRFLQCHFQCKLVSFRFLSDAQHRQDPSDSTESFGFYSVIRFHFGFWVMYSIVRTLQILQNHSVCRVLESLVAIQV
jgi:hypothetical protein